MDRIEGIVAVVRSRVTQNVDIAIICGSGLSGLSEIIEEPISIAYSELPFLPVTTVAGHGSELVFGRLHGANVLIAKGRFHPYEGHTAQQSAILVRVFAALGAKVLIVTNAAGAINPSFRVGDVMIIKDIVSFPGLAGNHALTGINDERFGPRFPAQGPAVFTVDLQVCLGAIQLIRWCVCTPSILPEYCRQPYVLLVKLSGWQDT
jgi:purine-nucleoside phosphorylase